MLLDCRSLHNHLTDSTSIWGRLLGSTPATQRYKVPPCGIKAQDFPVFCGGSLRYYAGGILLDSWFLHNRSTDFNPLCGRLLGMTLAPRRYKAHFYAANTHEVTTLTEIDTRRRHGETMSEVPPVFSWIRNSIEDYPNGLYECKIYCDPGQKAKGGPLTCFQSKSSRLDCISEGVQQKLWCPSDAQKI